jgi:osmotically-inducible protein OsmY
MEGSMGTNIENEVIRENVKKELLRNSLLKDEDILVDMEGDEVILQGDVDSFDKKWLAEDIATDSFGVLHVKNEIHITNQKEIVKGGFYEEE